MNHSSNPSPKPYPVKTTDSLGFASYVDEGPGDLLSRLVPGDPLGMGRLVQARLTERALLWDGEAICMRALALCAHRTVESRRKRLDRDWLLGFVDQAIEQLALGGDPQAEAGQQPVFEQLGIPLDFDPEAIARACRLHNRLPSLERLCFRALVIEGRDLDEVARELDRDGSTVGRAGREALETFFGSLVTPQPNRRDS